MTVIPLIRKAGPKDAKATSMDVLVHPGAKVKPKCTASYVPLSRAQVKSKLDMRKTTWEGLFTPPEFQIGFLNLIGYMVFIACITLHCDMWYRITFGICPGTPKSFAWVQFMKMLGRRDSIALSELGPTSSQDDNLSVLGVGMGSLPWIPVLLGLSCCFVLISFVGFYLSMYFSKNHQFRATRKMWKESITRLCIAGSFFCAISLIQICFTGFKTPDNSLRKDMLFTLKLSKPYLSLKEYEQWNITQSAYKCCGVYDRSDWQTPYYDYTEEEDDEDYNNGEDDDDNLNDNNDGLDTVYPMSCCNTDIYLCNENPKQYQTWSNGCLEIEKYLMKYFKDSVLFVVLTTQISIMLVALLVRRECKLFEILESKGQEIRVTLLGMNWFIMRHSQLPSICHV